MSGDVTVHLFNWTIVTLAIYISVRTVWRVVLIVIVLRTFRSIKQIETFKRLTIEDSKNTTRIEIEFQDNDRKELEQRSNRKFPKKDR